MRCKMKKIFTLLILCSCGTGFTTKLFPDDAGIDSGSGGSSPESSSDVSTGIGSSNSSSSIASVSGSVVASVATPASSSSGPCVPSQSCAGLSCGALDDGCGTLLDCGPYQRNLQCDANAPYTCACPQATPFAFECDATGHADGILPFSDCILNKNGPNELDTFCCPEAAIP